MTTTNDVPMPEPDAWRVTWSEHPFSEPELTTSRTRVEDIQRLESPPAIDTMHTGAKLRAYADARCAKLQAIASEHRDGRLRALEDVAALRAERDALAEKVKAMEDDARRYRWLRTFPNNVRPQVYAPCGLLMREEHLDAAIDAAGGDQA